MTHEVTQSLWTSTMGSNPSSPEEDGVTLIGDRLPVQNMSWCEAEAFANALSKRDGLHPAYRGLEDCEGSRTQSVTWDRTSNGWRLPTEAEWEYAARGGDGAGDVIEPAAMCRFANFADLSAKKVLGWTFEVPCDDGVVGLAPVGSYAPNAYGLFDMIGNVSEWSWDWKGPYASDAQRDPSGPAQGTARIHRGGSFIIFFLSDLRAANRWSIEPGIPSASRGLRLARSLP